MTMRWRGLPALVGLLAMVLPGCTVPAGSGPGSPSDSPLPDPSTSVPAAPTAAPTAQGTAGASPAESPGPAADPEPKPAVCRPRTAGLNLDQQVGQLIMAAIPSQGASAADRRALRGSAVGSVLLLGNTTAGADAVSSVTRAARRAAGDQRGVAPLIAADQEGGQVQRLRGDGFARIPAATEQAELSDAELTRNATRWARQLKAAGVDVDLAPVADLVPAELQDVNRPIGVLRRGYGSDPDVIAAKVRAFVRGMDAAGVATAVKHFPGLGRVRGNTDFEADVVDRRTRRGDPGLAGFRSGVDAGADLVMVASATYPRIDADRRAAFSPTVMDMVRSDLDFAGVIISDDLSAAAFADVPVRARALRFLRAGGDLAIVGDLSQVDEMAAAIADEASSDPDFARAVADKANRVVSLKARRGLARC